jgi:hypothetical protein
MVLTYSGNLGLGVTPSAWGTAYSNRAIQFGPVGSISSLQAATDNNQTFFASNAYNIPGTGWVYLYSDAATQYRQYAGTHAWFNAASGTAGNAITFTQAMTLHASGGLSIGATSDPGNGAITLQGTSNNGSINVRGASGYASYIWFTESSIADRYLIGSPSGSGDLVFRSNSYNFSTGTERARITSDGKLGVGTTNPLARIHGQSTTGDILILDSRDTTTGAIDTGPSIGFVGHDGVQARDFGRIALFKENGTSGNYASYMAFVTRANGGSLAERARIDSSGNLLVGTTSALNGTARLDVSAPAGNSLAATFKNAAGANEWNTQIWNAGTTGDNAFIQFATETTYTGRGSITYNRAGGLVAYNVSSDYRAKDIYGPVTGSGALIDSVPVYMGKMKGATQERPMFIAHETPVYAHTGEKDAVDADGNPVYQQMDASALIPVMWAEIQSLRKRLADAGI